MAQGWFKGQKGMNDIKMETVLDKVMALFRWVKLLCMTDVMTGAATH